MDIDKNRLLDTEAAYSIIKEIEKNPEITQRYLSVKYKISLGKVNFILKSLIDKGVIKARNFKNSKNKIAYLYNLTPEGIRTKAFMTRNFIERKISEYERLKREIEVLKSEISLEEEVFSILHEGDIEKVPGIVLKAETDANRDDKARTPDEDLEKV